MREASTTELLQQATQQAAGRAREERDRAWGGRWDWEEGRSDRARGGRRRTGSRREKWGRGLRVARVGAPGGPWAGAGTAGPLSFPRNKKNA